MLKKRLEMFSVSHPDVKHIKILVAGQVGAGKSSFINSVNNAFRGRMTSEAIVDQSSGKSFTKNVSIIFKLFNVQYGHFGYVYIYLWFPLFPVLFHS